MKFRNLPMMMLGAAAVAIAHAPAASMEAPPIGGELGLRPRRSRKGKGHNNKRGTGARSKPRKRPNRLIIGKRLRRKHRRARRAA